MSSIRGLTVAVAMFIVATTVAACGGSDPELSGYERSPLPSLAGLTLPAVETDGSSTDFALAAQPDELLVVYLGYTSCPDVCPTTLADIRTALGDLGDDADRVELAMITIDPDVDVPERLVGYVRSFVDEAVAIRSTDDAPLRAVADVLGADYGKEEVDGEAEVFHTASVYAIDDNGDLLVTWPFGTSPDAFAKDFEILLDRVS